MKINLSNTKLTTFKWNWFNEINKIIAIDISHNEIDLDILHDDIKHLNKLQTINFGYNVISSIEENSFTNFIHLQKIYLNNNRLDGIVHLGNLTKLKLLDYSGNSISEVSIHTFFICYLFIFFNYLFINNGTAVRLVEYCVL